MELKPCPFCGFEFRDDELVDTFYRSGTRWVDMPTMRRYFSHRDAPTDAAYCWTIHCAEEMGGCGASISGDTYDETAHKWNSRTAA